MAYPAALDSFNTIATSNYMDEAGYVLHTHLNQHGTSVVNIETTLGTNSGTSVIKNFVAGDFAARINASNVLQQALQGTINNSTFGTGRYTGGTYSGGVIGTNAITGGTISMTAGTLSSILLGTSQITGGTFASGLVGTSTVQGGTVASAAVNSPTLKDTRHTRFNFTDAATVSLDWSSGDWAFGTIAGNRTVSMSNGQAGGYYILQVTQDATGTRTLTYGTAVKWPGAGTTTLSTGAGKIDFIGFICDSANYFAIGDALNLS